MLGRVRANKSASRSGGPRVLAFFTLCYTSKLAPPFFFNFIHIFSLIGKVSAFEAASYWFNSIKVFFLIFINFLLKFLFFYLRCREKINLLIFVCYGLCLYIVEYLFYLFFIFDLDHSNFFFFVYLSYLFYLFVIGIYFIYYICIISDI
jgi:hypothetical protein